MARRKNPRKNYRKGNKIKRRFAFLRRLAVVLYIVIGVTALLVASCLFVLVHDVITQCDYFRAKSLQIEGGQRLNHKQILAVSQVQNGVNTLAVNLTMVRKRLLAHPWIAEAEVRREIPSGIHIRIQEHKPLAIVELDRKYLLSKKGRLFKKWTAADPANLPLVSGLTLSDIKGTANALQINTQPASAPSRHLKSEGSVRRPFEAVMQVLRMSEQVRGILSNRQIKQILVDREMGITLKVFKQMKTVVLGYHNYPLKFRMFENVRTYRRQRRSLPDFDRIDLNNVNRIVVSPVIQIPDGDRKEV